LRSPVKDVIDVARLEPTSFDRSRVEVGIVHIGLGVFARAHLAAYTQRVLEMGELEWGICGVSMRSAAVRDALEPQRCLYSLVEAGTSRLSVIGSVVRCLVEPEEPVAVRRAIADPAVRIVSLTVTEAGYGPSAPAIRLIVDALAARFAKGRAPFTVLCLDNLLGTGGAVRALAVERARRIEPALASWIGEQVSFPRTVVDRIVPRTADADRALVRDRFGVRDRWPVIAEAHSQWVLEDDFPCGRPSWERAGATVVEDAAPWEAVKFQIVNASHFALACLGMLAGYGLICDATRDPALESFVRRLLFLEVSRAIAPPPSFGLSTHVDETVRRFQDPALGYLAAKTVSNGSTKIATRLTPTVETLSRHGQGVEHLALVVAAWIRIVTGPLARDVEDPALPRIRRIVSSSSGDPVRATAGMFAAPGLLDPLGSIGGFAERVAEHSDVLAKQGIGAALALAARAYGE